MASVLKPYIMFFRPKKKRLLFVVISFNSGTYDYPKDINMPSVGDYVGLNGSYGQVKSITHSTQDNVTKIKIDCTKP